MGVYEYKKISKDAEPIPVVPVQITAPEENSNYKTTCEGIIDSGCDRTLIPQEIIAALNLKDRPSVVSDKIGITNLRTVIDNGSEVKIEIREAVIIPVILGVIFDGNLHIGEFLCCKAIVTGGSVFLGRDILNSYTIKLNGPARKCTISKRYRLRNN